MFSQSFSRRFWVRGNALAVLILLLPLVTGCVGRDRPAVAEGASGAREVFNEQGLAAAKKYADGLDRSDAHANANRLLYSMLELMELERGSQDFETKLKEAKRHEEFLRRTLGKETTMLIYSQAFLANRSGDSEGVAAALQRVCPNALDHAALVKCHLRLMDSYSDRATGFSYERTDVAYLMIAAGVLKDYFDEPGFVSAYLRGLTLYDYSAGANYASDLGRRGELDAPILEAYCRTLQESEFPIARGDLSEEDITRCRIERSSVSAPVD